MLFYLNSPLDEEASHIPKLVFFGESYGARRCWTSATPPFHAPPRRSSESQEKLPPNNRWSDSKETRTSRNFFVRRPKKRIGASKLVSFDTPWHPFPPQNKKTLQEYMNIILGYFFDWILFDKNTDGYPQKKRIGPTWKRPGSWKLAPRNKNNRKTHGNFCHDPIFPGKPWFPCFQFLFSARFIGEKKTRKKDNCPKQTTSKQPGLHFLLILNQEALPSPLMLSKAFLAAFAALKRFEPRVMWSDRVLWRVDWRGRVCF